jgi:riboflavin biosynthesis pyrimidine reductase
VSSLARSGLVDRLRLVVLALILGETGREPTLCKFPDIKLELLTRKVLDGRLLGIEYAVS